MTYTAMVHRVGSVPMLTLTSPRGRIDLSQGQCAAEVTGWDMTSRIAVAIGCKPPPDDDGFWALPNGNIIHHDDLMVELADLVREVMDAELTARVAPVGPLTLEAAP